MRPVLTRKTKRKIASNATISDGYPPSKARKSQLMDVLNRVALFEGSVPPQTFQVA